MPFQPVGFDTNVRKFASSLFVQNARNMMLWGYDSTVLDPQTTDQGVYFAAAMKTWQFPLRADGSSPWVSVASSAGSSLSRVYSAGVSAQGWTSPVTRAAGANWSASDNGYSAQQAYEWTIASGSTRTACTASAQASVASLAGFMEGVPSTHSWQTTSHYFDLFGGDPWSGKHTASRTCWFGFANSPVDMRMVGVRQLQGTKTLSTANSAWVNATTMTAMNSTGVKTYVVDMGNGVGEPWTIVCNPTSTVSGTAYRMGFLGMRTYRHDGSLNPLDGVGIMVIATGGHNITQFAACIGVTGTGNSPDPYFSTANAQEYIRQMCGNGSGKDFPNKVVLIDGHNFTGTEQSQLGAGTTTAAVANRLAVVNQLNAMADALSSPRPDILFITAPYHENDFSGVLRRTFMQAVQTVAQQTGNSVLDLWTRTAPTNTVYGANTFAAATPFYTKGAVVTTQAGSSTGPTALANLDFLHPSQTGAELLMTIVWNELREAAGVLNVGYQTTGGLLPTSERTRIGAGVR